MTVKDVAADIVSHLNGQTLGSVALTSGTNLFSDLEHVAPTLSVIVNSSGGPPPVPYLHSTASAMFTAAVQIFVRGNAGLGGHEQGEAVARGVLGYLQQNAPSGYVSLLSRTSQPEGLVDADGRNLFSLNFDARFTG